jgi:hypothetical protein
VNEIRHIVIAAVAVMSCGAHAQLTREQAAAGCVVDGRLIRCPSSMRHVEAQGIRSVEAQGIKSVEAQGIDRVEAQGIKRYEARDITPYQAPGITLREAKGIIPREAQGVVPRTAQSVTRREAQDVTRREAGAPPERHKSTPRPNSIDAEAAARGKAIDPQGRGLTQAQIDAMEVQRRLMWNTTGGDMVYR